MDLFANPNVAVGVISLLVAIGGVIAAWQRLHITNRQNIERMEASYIDITNAINQRMTTLSAEFRALYHEHDELRKQYESLKADHSALLLKVRVLERENADLHARLMQAGIDLKQVTQDGDEDE